MGTGCPRGFEHESSDTMPWIQRAHNTYRYESAHEHRPCAHKHVYDVLGHGGESAVIELFQEDEIPTLGEVIRELEEWHETNAGRIKNLR